MAAFIDPENTKIDSGGRRRWYRMPAVIARLIERSKKGRFGKMQVGSNGHTDDEMPSGPALERWQAAKAQREEIRLELDKKSFVAVEYVREAFTAVAACFRRAGDTLQRTFGPGAHEIVEEAAKDAEREVEARFGG